MLSCVWVYFPYHAIVICTCVSAYVLMCIRTQMLLRAPCATGPDSLPPLSGRPLTICLNYWPPKRVSGLQMSPANAVENLISRSQISTVWRGEEKNVKTFSTKLSQPNSRESKEEGKKTLKENDKYLISLSLSLWLFIWALHAIMSRWLCWAVCDFLITFNSEPPAECLHLPLSEGKDGKKILKRQKAWHLTSSEIDPSWSTAKEKTPHCCL